MPALAPPAGRARAAFLSCALGLLSPPVAARPRRAREARQRRESGLPASGMEPQRPVWAGVSASHDGHTASRFLLSSGGASPPEWYKWRVNLIAADTSTGPTLTPALIVSILALLFTIASFWWIQVRRSRLRSYPPLSYAGALTRKGLMLNLPLVLYNTGPAPIVILDFRLRIVSTSDEESLDFPLLLSWYAIQPRLEPAPVGGGRVMPSPIALNGRQAVERFIEFGRRSAPSDLVNGPYNVTVEVRLAHKGASWSRLVQFDLHTELAKANARNAYLQHTNDPEWTE